MITLDQIIFNKQHVWCCYSKLWHEIFLKNYCYSRMKQLLSQTQRGVCGASLNEALRAQFKEDGVD